MRGLQEENAHLRRRVAELEARLALHPGGEGEILPEQAILQAIPDIVFLLDENGRYLEILTQHDELLYREVSQLLGKTLDEVLPPDVAASAVLCLKTAIEARAPQIIDYALELPDGRHWFEGRCAALPHEIGRDGLRKAVWVAHDITARYAMTDRLRAENERLEQQAAIRDNQFGFISLVEQAQIMATYRIEADGSDMGLGQLVYASPTMKDLLGCEDLMDLKNWFTALHPDDRERVYRKSMHCLQCRENYLDEFRLLVDGKTRWIKVISLPSMLDGRYFYNGLVIDISAQKKTEDALKQAIANQQDMASMLRRSPFVTALIGAEPGWPIQYVSENIAAYGYDPQELIGQNSREMIHPEDRERIARELEDAVRKGVSEISQDYRITDSGGTVRWVEDHSVIRVNAAGKATHYEVIMSDITERKLAEQALRESEERYRSLFEYATDAIFWIEPRQFRIINSNAAAEHLIGKPHPALLGMDFRDLFEPSRRESYAAMFTASIAQAGLLSREVELLGAGGHAKRVLLGASVTVAGAQPVVQLICHDLTDFALAQQALVRSERMAAVGVLAAGVAHEFNNLHTGMLGFLELTLETSDLSGTDREMLERALRIGRRASGITRNLLAFSCKGKTAREMTDLGHVIDDTLALVAGEFRSEGIQIQTELAAVGEFLFDRSQIGQVVLNLLINARHALRDRPEKTIRIRLCRDGESCRLRIEDNGIGIPPERIKDLFLPFFTTKGEHAEKGSGQAAVRGTGLGLSVSERIVKDHGGEILVESEPGRGTAFTVVLPFERDERQQPACHAPSPVPHMVLGARVLVLDDEDDVRDLLSSSLRRRGYAVTGLADGHAALEMHGEVPFDLILLDLQMPSMGGSEFLQRLRVQNNGASPHVVVVTGKLTDVEDGTLRTPPVRDVILKPFSVSMLCDRIYQILNES